MTRALLIRSTVRLALFAACTAAIHSAHAWGTEGHKTVARAAEEQLTPQARKQITALLAQEPGATLASISNWADVTRSRVTAPWHYVNLPRDADCIYSAPRDCPNGSCVVAAIEAQAHRLVESRSASERLEALKYLVHFVVDIHQPLHAAFADDRGGNDYQVQAFGLGMNLHSLWDTWIVKEVGAGSMSLDGSMGHPSVTSPASVLAPALWAGESCRLASRPDFYPSRRVDGAYLAKHVPLARARLQLAAIRLAALLNQAFDTRRERTKHE